ncbi:MAG: helix-turn-helix domain-containing protein [Pseudomonadota bacterium]
MTEKQVTSRHLLTTHEAAGFLSLSHRTLEKMRVRGDGPAFIQLGRAIRYEECELESWINNNRKNSTSDCHD